LIVRNYGTNDFQPTIKNDIQDEVRGDGVANRHLAGAALTTAMVTASADAFNIATWGC
jgi:hypothetical protein